VHTIRKLSGCNTISDKGPLVLVKSLIRHPFKLIGKEEVFLSSIHSKSGKPTFR
jgi:hypothetical protein